MVALGAAGSMTYDGPSAISNKTLFDLGNATAPIVATAALRLEEGGDIDLNSSIKSMIPTLRNGPIVDATGRELLRHLAGVDTWGGLYLDVPHDPGSGAAKRWIVSEVSRRPSPRGRGHEFYSDLGLLLVGEGIAKAAGRSLDRIVRSEITEALGISGDLLYPAALSGDRRARLARRTAPTERCAWRGRIVAGEVHDENCAALGGVAGHAGLFATAEAMATFGAATLKALAGTGSLITQAAVQSATRPLPDQDGSPSFGESWQLPKSESTHGKRLGSSAYGVDSLTGCSLWCDPDTGLSISLLTNRIHPSRSNTRIEGFRPAFLDAVLARFSS